MKAFRGYVYTMKFLLRTVAISLLLVVPGSSIHGRSTNQEEEPVALSVETLLLSQRSAELSILSYTGKEEEPSFEFYRYFLEEPDKAIVVGADGYCFAAFRGTTPNVGDWKQDFVVGFSSVCNSTEEDESNSCCNVRTGFDQAYNASFRADLEDAIVECVDVYASCDDETSCVVLTGHSQGGAIASVAALYLAKLNPYVISFGQPPTLQEANCSLVQSDRWFRYVNTYNDFLGLGHIGYDIEAVHASIPPTEAGATQVGHMILFPSENSIGIAYLGLDPPDWVLGPPSYEAHDMIESYGETAEYHPGYLDHINFLLNTGSFPILLTGFVDGSLCTEDRECESGNCRRKWWSIFLDGVWTKRCS